MGFKKQRFESSVLKQLLCELCHEVLEDPKQCQDEHLFCRRCIRRWLKEHKNCPVDNASLINTNLFSLPKVLHAMLSDLDIRCDYEAHGCSMVVKLGSLADHLEECDFDPKRPKSVAIQVSMECLACETKQETIKRKSDADEARISALESRVKRLKEDINKPSSELEELKKMIFERDGKLKELGDSNSKLLERIDHLKRQADNGRFSGNINKRLLTEKLITFYVFDVMEKVQLPLFNHFSNTEDHLNEARRVGKILRNGLKFVRAGHRILFLLNYPYLATCLAIHSQQSGRVVTISSTNGASGFQALFTERRLILVSGQEMPDFTRDGCPSLAPYDIVFTQHDTISQAVASQVCRPEGLVINIMSGRKVSAITNVANYALDHRSTTLRKAQLLSSNNQTTI